MEEFENPGSNEEGQSLIIREPSNYSPKLLINFLIAAVAALIGTIIFLVVTFVPEISEMEMGVIFLPVLALFYFFGSLLSVSVSLTILHFFKSDYKFVWTFFVSSLLILILSVFPYLSEAKEMLFVLLFPGAIVSSFNFVMLWKNKNKKYLFYFLITILLSGLLIFIMRSNYTNRLEINHQARSKIDIKTILPDDYSDDYIVTYDEDKNSDYQTIYIDSNKKIQGNNVNYFQGIVQVSLVKQNYDFSNKEAINIDGFEFERSCSDYYICDIRWKRDSYYFYIDGVMSGGHSTNIDKNAVKNQLIEIMDKFAITINDNSSYLYN